MTVGINFPRQDTFEEKIAHAHGGVHHFWRISDPKMATLRAYRVHHPFLKVFVVQRNGRCVWLTWKQLMILRYFESSHHRSPSTATKPRKLRLADIAKACGCSTSTVSRTLLRFDLWRFFDYITFVGRRGGVYVKTRHAIAKSDEADANLSGARITYQSRKIARSWLATQIRIKEFRYRMMLKMRPKKIPIWRPTSGSMDGMFWKPIEA